MKMQNKNATRDALGHRREGGGACVGGIVIATNINSDGTVLALRIPIPNWSPGAIAFALSHD